MCGLLRMYCRCFRRTRRRSSAEKPNIAVIHRAAVKLLRHRARRRLGRIHIVHMQRQRTHHNPRHSQNRNQVFHAHHLTSPPADLLPLAPADRIHRFSPPPRLTHFPRISDKPEETSSEVCSMRSTPYIAKPVLTERDAIASHMRWRITLLLAARMHEPLTDRATRTIHQSGRVLHPEMAPRQANPAPPRHSEYRAVRDLPPRISRPDAAYREPPQLRRLRPGRPPDQPTRNLPEHLLALANAIMALGRCAVPVGA